MPPPALSTCPSVPLPQQVGRAGKAAETAASRVAVVAESRDGQTDSVVRRHDFFIFSFSRVVLQTFFLFPKRNLSLFELATYFFVACIFVFVSLSIAGMAKRRTLILSHVAVSSGRSSQKCQVKQKNTSGGCFYVHGRTHFFLLGFFSFHVAPSFSSRSLTHSCSLFPGDIFILGQEAACSSVYFFLSHLTPFT